MKSISIALATYNGERFLEEQLQSLAMQSLCPIELIVSDDGSTDNTLNILRDFSRFAPFEVRILQNERRLGYRANFIHCANLCRGSLIAFCDQDDIWRSDKLQTQTLHFDDPEILLSTHNVRLIDENSKYLGSSYQHLPTERKYALIDMFPLTFTEGFTHVFRKELLVFSRLAEFATDGHHPDQMVAHDEWYFFLSTLFGSVFYSTENLADYRRHGNNASGAKPTRAKGIMKILSSKLGSQHVLETCKMSATTKNRMDILSRIRSECGGSEIFLKYQENFKFSDKIYTDFLKRVSNRYTVVMTPKLKTRVAALRIAVSSGDYRNVDKWHFTLPGLLRDCVCLLSTPRKSKLYNAEAR